MNLNTGKPYRAVLGFAGLLGVAAAVVAGKAAAGPSAQATAAAMPGAAQPTSASSPSTATTTPGTAAATAGSASTAAPSTSGTRTVVGAVEDTRYGPVQVEIVVTGGKITDVVTLQVPSQDRHDLEINAQAVPILRQEVLAAQSAKIDAVSGASFTSSGYAWSVQAAIDKAGLGT